MRSSLAGINLCFIAERIPPDKQDHLRDGSHRSLPSLLHERLISAVHIETIC
jgi:hypothetical protein